MWREWIKRKGIKEVAFLLDVHPETVRGWVNGKRPKDEHKKRLVAIAGNEFGYSDFFADIGVDNG